MRIDKKIEAALDAVPDAEEHFLAQAIEHKQKAIAALAAAGDARKERDKDTTGIEAALDLEQMTMAGYQRALDNRRLELGRRELKRGRR